MPPGHKTVSLVRAFVHEAGHAFAPLVQEWSSSSRMPRSMMILGGGVLLGVFTAMAASRFEPRVSHHHDPAA